MTKKKEARTPLSVARTLRTYFEANIAKTWDEYFRQRQANDPNSWEWLNAWRFAKHVQEQLKCEYAVAAAVTEEVCPELFADYWAALAKA